MSSSTSDHTESQKPLFEVVCYEKQLLPLMSSKGILHGDVMNIYHEVRTGYERILLHSDQIIELQEVEYLLWKLHYKHIVEFRKRIDNIKCFEPENDDSQSKYDCHLGAFTLFLTNAANFYRSLIIQLRRNCGLPEKVFLDVEEGIEFSIAQTKLDKCRFICHRLIVCIGDLARYSEILKRPEEREWFVSASYYLEAGRTWSNSGNPHNQLALLATYIGDSFLALYHCVRSLAIKEPFPDAWRNLVLLFEETCSTQLPSCSSDSSFDYSNPSKKSFLVNKSPDLEVPPDQTGLWLAVIRIISFFIIRSSIDDFPKTFGVTLRSLEALLASDDEELSIVLESYELTNSIPEGPHRAIQLVSVFIFLIDIPKVKDPLRIEKKTHLEYTRLAFVVVFVCMGRIIERCRHGSRVNCPLLPAVLVFVEWFVGALDEADSCTADERVMNAMSYFLGSLSDLLNELGRNDIDPPDKGIALWEDRALRGFQPLGHLHDRLNFSIIQKNSEEARKIRIRRVFFAALKIVDQSKSSLVWLTYDEDGGVFSVVEKAVYQPKGSAINEVNGSPVEAELTTNDEDDEEEVILFKPIKRHNSAPICVPESSNDSVSTVPRKCLDESLCRAVTFTTSHQREESDSFSFCPEPSSNEPWLHHSRPPSLSGWVLGRGISNSDQDYNKNKLDPIDEMISTVSLSDKTQDPEPAREPYVAPLPSAPYLPDAIMAEPDGIHRTPIGYLPRASNHINGYPANIGMSSSEWLYHYRNRQQMENLTNHLFPYPPLLENFQATQVCRLDLCDQWGNRLASNPMVYLGIPQPFPHSPLVYGGPEREQVTDKFFNSHQRSSSPYLCGIGMDIRSEQSPLLQYLKDREPELHPRSPNAFIGK